MVSNSVQNCAASCILMTLKDPVTPKMSGLSVAPTRETLMAYEQKLKRNPFDFEACNTLIEAYVLRNDAEAVTRFREHAAVFCPTTEEFWMCWINDQKDRLACTPTGPGAIALERTIVQLYRSSVAACPTADLWVSYLKFLKQRQGPGAGSLGTSSFVDLAVPPSQFNASSTRLPTFSSSISIAHIRRTCESAVRDLGLHATEGPKIWSFYRHTEQALLRSILERKGSDFVKEPGSETPPRREVSGSDAVSASLMTDQPKSSSAGMKPLPTAGAEADATPSPDPMKHVLQQVARVRSLFSRQLALPLAGLQDLWDEYRIFEAELPNALKAGPETAERMASLHAAGLAEWEKRKALELQVMMSEDDKLETIQRLSDGWSEYIRFERRNDPGHNQARVNTLYLRACEDLGHLRLDLWFAWCEWVMAELKDPSRAAMILDRAVRLHPAICKLWVFYLACQRLRKPRDLERKRQIFFRGVRGLDVTSSPCDIVTLCQAASECLTDALRLIREQPQSRGAADTVPLLPNTFPSPTLRPNPLLFPGQRSKSTASSTSCFSVSDLASSPSKTQIASVAASAAFSPEVPSGTDDELRLNVHHAVENDSALGPLTGAEALASPAGATSKAPSSPLDGVPFSTGLVEQCEALCVAEVCLQGERRLLQCLISLALTEALRKSFGSALEPLTPVESLQGSRTEAQSETSSEEPCSRPAEVDVGLLTKNNVFDALRKLWECWIRMLVVDLKGVGIQRLSDQGSKELENVCRKLLFIPTLSTLFPHLPRLSDMDVVSDYCERFWGSIDFPQADKAIIINTSGKHWALVAEALETIGVSLELFKEYFSVLRLHKHQLDQKEICFSKWRHLALVVGERDAADELLKLSGGQECTISSSALPKQLSLDPLAQPSWTSVTRTTSSEDMAARFSQYTDTSIMRVTLDQLKSRREKRRRRLSESESDAALSDASSDSGSIPPLVCLPNSPLMSQTGAPQYKKRLRAPAVPLSLENPTLMVGTRDSPIQSTSTTQSPTTFSPTSTFTLPGGSFIPSSPPQPFYLSLPGTPETSPLSQHSKCCLPSDVSDTSNCFQIRRRTSHSAAASPTTMVAWPTLYNSALPNAARGGHSGEPPSNGSALSPQEIDCMERLTRSTWDGHECGDPSTAPPIPPITSVMSPLRRRSWSNSSTSSSQSARLSPVSQTTSDVTSTVSGGVGAFGSSVRPVFSAAAFHSEALLSDLESPSDTEMHHDGSPQAADDAKEVDGHNHYCSNFRPPKKAKLVQRLSIEDEDNTFSDKSEDEMISATDTPLSSEHPIEEGSIKVDPPCPRTGRHFWQSRTLEPQTLKPSNADADAVEVPQAARLTDLLGQKEESFNVFVSNLDTTVTEADLRDLFSNADGLKEIRLVRDFRNRFKGFSYIEFDSAEAASRAVETHQGLSLNERPLRVQISKPTAPTYEPTTLFFSGLAAPTLSKDPGIVKNAIVTAIAANTERLLQTHKAIWPKDVRLRVDEDTNRLKGYGYIDFETQEDAATVLKTLVEPFELEIVEGHCILAPSIPMKRHKPILAPHNKALKRTEKEKPKQAPPLQPQTNTVFVKNLSFQTTPEGLQRHFEMMGPVDNVLLCRSADGTSKGFGFVTFVSSEDAFSSRMLNDSTLDGREISVSASHRAPTMPKSHEKKAFQHTQPAKGPRGQQRERPRRLCLNSTMTNPKECEAVKHSTDPLIAMAPSSIGNLQTLAVSLPGTGAEKEGRANDGKTNGSGRHALRNADFRKFLQL